MVLAFSVVLEVKGENFSYLQSNPKEEPIMKKKKFVTLAALALAATALAVPAAAHGHGGWNGECRQAVSCLDADGTCGRGNYADEDGDGVCDNCGTACGYWHYADEDGDGFCDNCGIACGYRHYADEDGDGVCDNCGGVHTVQRYGGGNGHHGGRHRCR